MKILIACEMSGRVRSAFRRLGHAAWSCDIVPSLDNSDYHIQGDVSQILSFGWDAMIGFPPCTYLARSGAQWWPTRQEEQSRALDFVRLLMEAPIEKIAIENPVGKISTAIRKPDQIIQPWMFGHGETKATCLWLKGFEPLIPTDVVPGRESKVHRMPPGPQRSMLRSLTYQGIADAMAAQWGAQ